MPIVLLVAAVFTLLPGCNIVTPVAYIINGPGNVESRYELDPKLATVVFVDDPAGRITDRRIRGVMARSATETLLREADMEDMIDSASIQALAVRDSYSDPMSITEMGAAVEADMVIYVVVHEFTLTGPANTFLPTTAVAVKVLDVNAGQRLWPNLPEGARVSVGGEYEPGNIPQSRAGLMKAQEGLAAKMGVAIGQLFYKHEITESVTRR